MQIYNIYCDESCHLEKDQQNVMVLGAIWCPLEKSKEIAIRIREIKLEHSLKQNFEIKWTKVSPAKLHFYLELLDYFFDNSDLHFRALIVPDKAKLRHAEFNQSHDDFYYKMYFDMLKIIINPNATYRIYIDIKDTKSAQKAEKLHEVLCNNQYDFSRSIIERLQTVRSHEVEILQLTDLLIGAVSYVNRGLDTSHAKSSIVQRFRYRSGYRLTQSTLYKEDKVNLFYWHAS
jgi:hypothetical protein